MKVSELKLSQQGQEVEIRRGPYCPSKLRIGIIWRVAAEGVFVIFAGYQFADGEPRPVYYAASEVSLLVQKPRCGSANTFALVRAGFWNTQPGGAAS